MKNLIRYFICHILAIIFSVLLSFSAYAENNVKASLVSDTSAIVSGSPFRLAVKLDAPEGWHTYWKDPGDAGIPTKLNWELPAGFSAGEIDWPEPRKMQEGTLKINGYIGTTILPVTITTPDKLSAEAYDLRVNAEWLACNEICIPESQELSINLPVRTTSKPQNTELFLSPRTVQPDVKKNSEFPILAIILSAVVGGLILNIMPCVLPVLSLKTLALVKKSGQVSRHTFKYGVAYTLGILLSFAIIAAVLITLQKSGEAVGWGFQMQSPAFVGFLIYLLFLVGLNLSGLFHLPVLLGGVGQNITNENTLRGSFFTGILATLVATPCTAPFMASAVGAALTLPAWAAMLTFLGLGFGLALPFLLISIFPFLLRFLPKPGAWMERFKEFLSFPMYGAVIWLLWVLGMQKGVDGVILTICGLLLISFMIWLQNVAGGHKSEPRIFTIITVAIMLGAILFSLSQNQDKENFIPYSPSALAELRKEGKAVYVDATAAWCITCQLNKRIAIDTPKTRQAFTQYNVVFMVADWTRKNPEITEFLRSFGYNGVPLNVFYPAGGGEPVVLPQILSEQIVIDTIKNPVSP